MSDPSNLPRNPKSTTQVTLQRNADGSSTRTGTQCNVVPTKGARAQVTAAMARDEAEKLLPHPTIGTAPTGHATLVNIETVLWLDTPTTRTLGTVTLLDRQVTLRAHLDTTVWDFGDHTGDTTHDAGRKYTNADPCRTPSCPSYYGHIYRHTGPVTITAQLSGTGQFRVDNGPWQPIAGAVTALATDDNVTVKQARGILVPNP